jgi:hypothetical protein
MGCFHSYHGHWRFQQIVAWLLLAIFVPIAILSEGAHLLPGLGTCCQWSDDCDKSADHDHDQFCGSSHHNSQQRQHQNSHQQDSDSIPVDVCVVCEFCSIFNSTVIVPQDFLETPYVSSVEVFEFVKFSGEFFSLFLARAPPVEV